MCCLIWLQAPPCTAHNLVFQIYWNISPNENDCHSDFDHLEILSVKSHPRIRSDKRHTKSDCLTPHISERAKVQRVFAQLYNDDIIFASQQNRFDEVANYHVIRRGGRCGHTLVARPHVQNRGAITARNLSGILIHSNKPEQLLFSVLVAVVFLSRYTLG